MCVSDILKPCFKLEILAGEFFFLRGAYFNRYVQLKGTFLTKKISAMKSEALFSREAIEN